MAVSGMEGFVDGEKDKRVVWIKGWRLLVRREWRVVISWDFQSEGRASVGV
jgi:hypothetical protein